MNSTVPPDAVGDETPGGGLAFGDILFTLFRHKVLIFCSVLLGISAALAVRYLKPPKFESTAQLYVPFVVEITPANPNDPESGMTKIPSNGEMQLNTEVDILQSFDTALVVADKIGPEKILAKYGGGSNRLAAAGVIASGITVTPPRTMSLTVTFAHRDERMVQPIMQAILDVYKQRSKLLHLPIEQLVATREDAKARLATVEDAIEKLRADAKVPNIRQRLEAISGLLTSLGSKILESQGEIARRKAELGELSQGNTNSVVLNPIPAEVISTYSDTIGMLDDIKRRKRSLLVEEFLTTNHPTYLKVEVRMQEQLRIKHNLEEQYPMLTNYISSVPRGGTSSNSVPRFDLEGEQAELKRLDRGLEADLQMKEQLTQESFQLLALERKLTELERQRDTIRKEYIYADNSLEKTKEDDTASGKTVNMKEMQSPTPPALNMKKFLKLVGMAFGGCIGMGLGIAFLLDLVLDRTIRRPSQIVRSLKLPVMLAIPDMHRKEPTLLPWTGRNKNLKVMRPDKHQQKEASALAPWSPDNQLQSHIEGLRERVITYFEARRINHHPKLVALTACSDGAGVSTLASGLAATLSRTGHGSVLLIDMNVGEGVTHSFYKGKPGYGPAESIEADSDDEPRDSESDDANANLALTKANPSDSARSRLDGMLPPEFDKLFPKLKADAYDYVVFDMTHISPASVTPRMAGRMDLVLLIIESEKTKDHEAKSARLLMKESRANVMAILNKYYNPVPGWLAHD